MCLLGLFLLLLALLAVPVDLAFRLRISAGFEGRLTIGWLFGLIRIPVRLGGERSKKKAEKRRKKRVRKAKKPRRGGRPVFLSGEFWRWLLGLLRRLLARIHVYRLFLSVNLGLDDPADTGRLWGGVGPVAAMLAAIPLADVRIQPNFEEAALLVESEGEIRIYPLAIIATVVATALSPATWRVFRKQGGKG